MHVINREHVEYDIVRFDTGDGLIETYKRTGDGEWFLRASDDYGMTWFKIHEDEHLEYLYQQDISDHIKNALMRGALP
jgi:hypothetical protein